MEQSEKRWASKGVAARTKEVTRIIVKAAVVVGILGIIGRFLSPKIEDRLKKVVFSAKE